jgi:cell division protein FtsB
MYGVSLLPPEYKTQLQEGKRSRLVVLIAIVIAAVMLVLFMLTMVFKWSHLSDISALEAEQEQLQTQINELKDEEIIVNEIMNTTLNISELLVSASKLSTNIVRVGDALSTRVAVTEITMEYDLETITGTLQLQAPDEQTLRQCMEQLRLLDGVTNVAWSELTTTGTGLMPVSCKVTLGLQRVALI